MNWFKRLFCKNETREITPINPNAVVANYLNDLTLSGGFSKTYEGVEEFINIHIDVTQPSDLSKVTESTPEIEKLKKKFKVLHYKFEDNNLRNFIFN